mmetsp:Transcript_4892/g.7623  ORF Transcript_4892/g.7623 Transcript_4892/m.7623 type:complete len:600 (-) Transcript_4892:1622-3421(-)
MPNQAYSMGWMTLMWAASIPTAIVTFISLSARLRKIGILRNHQSPVDFITDRFRSQVLRYTSVVLIVFPSLMYLTAQMVAIRGTFNSLFKIPADSPWAVLVTAAIIVVFEWVGGLRGVALTDCVQGIIMFACFICLPLIVFRHYGGWASLDWETYPKQNFFQTPSREQQWMYWQFVVMFITVGMYPHIIQRIYAADSFKSIKYAYSVISLAPWFAVIPAIFLGTMSVQILVDNGIENVTSPFASMLELIMDLGGFAYVVGVIASTATLAAIMSTADSVLIAISQLLTSEVFTHVLPKSSPKVICILGRLSTFLIMALALVAAFLGGQNLIDLILIQNGLMLNNLPIYFFGLYGRSIDPHPWILCFSAICGAATVAILHYTYLQRDPENQPVMIAAGIAGAGLNFALVVLLEGVRSLWSCYSKKKGEEQSDNSHSIPTWDLPNLSRFDGGHNAYLSSDFIWEAMEGIREPLVEHWFVFLMVGITVLLTPFTEPSTPPLDDTGNLVWAPNLVNGIPAWAFQIVMILVPLTIFLLYCIMAMSDDLFPENQSKQPLSAEEQEERRGLKTGAESSVTESEGKNDASAGAGEEETNNELITSKLP